MQNLAERNTHTSSSLSESYAHRQQSAAAAFMSRDKCYASSANLVGMGGGGDFTTDATSFSGSEEKEVVDERPDFPSMQKQKHASLMKRVASTPVISTQSAGPAPGSQEMRDMFFVRQDAVNFNASYGTPVRQVRVSRGSNGENRRGVFLVSVLFDSFLFLSFFSSPTRAAPSFARGVCPRTHPNPSNRCNVPTALEPEQDVYSCLAVYSAAPSQHAHFPQPHLPLPAYPPRGETSMERKSAEPCF